MGDILKDLYEIVEKRKAEKEEGSYTAYLIDQGLDKILKKLGEETAETIIAAKNFEAVSNEDLDPYAEKKALENEVGDLLYHLVVMLDILDISIDDIEDVLRERMNKTRNLKEGRVADKNT